jgi:hypothetical protein
VAVGLGLLAVALERVAAMAGGPAGGALRASDFLDPDPWVAAVAMPSGEPKPVGAFEVFFHGAFTPRLLTAGALLGLVAAAPRARVLLVGWLACVLLPVLPKGFPLADALRLQLPAQAAFVALAGVGFGALAKAAITRFGPLGGAFRWAPGVACLVWLPGVARGRVHQEEWGFLRDHVGELEAGTTVLYLDGPRAEKLALVMTELAPGTSWLGMTSFLDGDRPAGPVVAYEGLMCVAAMETSGVPLSETCRRLEASCRLSPVRVQRLRSPADLDLRVPADGVVVGLYRVEDCSRDGRSAEVQRQE